MKRKIDAVLQTWADESHKTRKPLLVRGVRQCGKTYAVEQMLKNKFPKSSSVLNLEEDSDLIEIFETAHSFDHLLTSLSGYLQVDLINQLEHAIFIDEIQKSPAALQFLRFFKEKKPNLHVICAGSYLEYTLGNASIPVGRTTSYFMGPMNFEEFLWAKNQEYVVTHHLKPFGQITQNRDIAAFVENYKPLLSMSLHRKLMQEVYCYELVGGMPAAVKRHVGSSLLRDARREQLDLIEAFRDDFKRYAKHGEISEKDLNNINLIFANLIPLAQKVKYSTINRDDKGSQIQRAIKLLTDIRLFHEIGATTAVTPPLLSQIEPNDKKLFICDLGLYNAMLNTPIAKVITDEVHFSHSGGLAELFVILSLIYSADPWRRDHDTFFWRKHHSGGAEIDALIMIGSTLCPIEVKRTRMRSCKSLVSYLNKVDNAQREGLFAGMSCLPLVVQGDSAKMASPLVMGGPDPRICRVPPYLIPFLTDNQ